MSVYTDAEIAQISAILEGVNLIIADVMPDDEVAVAGLVEALAHIFIINVAGAAIDSGIEPREIWKAKALHFTEMFAHVIATTMAHLPEVMAQVKKVRDSILTTH